MHGILALRVHEFYFSSCLPLFMHQFERNTIYASVGITIYILMMSGWMSVKTSVQPTSWLIMLNELLFNE